MPAPSRFAVAGGAQATGDYLTRRYTAAIPVLTGPAELDRAWGGEQEWIRRHR
jgi:hypothetical protein